jgi:hypothetical protein
MPVAFAIDRGRVSLSGRRGLQRLHDDGLDGLVGDGPRRADARFVVQPGQAIGNKLTPPLRHGRFCRAQTLGDGGIRCLGTGQHDSGSERDRTVHAHAFCQAH